VQPSSLTVAYCSIERPMPSTFVSDCSLGKQIEPGGAFAGHVPPHVEVLGPVVTRFAPVP
jgi:hypothetical protein